jgi:release factor glutamine methyltransferase
MAHPRIVDLGTGSGAIAGSIAHEVPGAEVHAVEFSPFAHAWAAKNLGPLGVRLVLGDLRNALPELNGTFDVVVSNPPYIPVGMVPIDPEVRDHDPELALYGGSEDGLAIPLAVAARAAVLLHPGGVLVMEHADTQGETLPAALTRTGLWCDIADHEDLNARPRATVAVRA